MKFRPDNKIRYGQDHAFHRGIPAGVDFKVKPFVQGRFVLTACGYGCLERHSAKCYGNGSLYPYGLTARQRSRFKREARRV